MNEAVGVQLAGQKSDTELNQPPESAVLKPVPAQYWAASQPIIQQHLTNKKNHNKHAALKSL